MTEVAPPARASIRSRTTEAWRSVSALFPGLALVALVAMSAKLVTEHHGGPVLLMAILMGMAVGFLRENDRLSPGLKFASKSMLRLGVAMLGAQITFQYLADLGWLALLFVVAGVILAILSGVGFSRALGQPAGFGILAGGAVGICGASAAAAIAAVLPRHERSDADTAVTIIGVTALSTAAMVAYPIIGHALGLDGRSIGFFLGLTIHDVAQVVGAGYSVSDEAGDIAVTVKMFRVILLLPVVVIVGLIVRSATPDAGTARSRVPLFVIGFAALVTASSFQLVSASVSTLLSEVSRWCLIVAMSAIGIGTSLGEIRELGYRPALVLFGSTVAIAILGLLGGLQLAGLTQRGAQAGILLP